MYKAEIALNRFELHQAWEREYESDPAWMIKHRIMEAMLPNNIRSVLDVGCGNGAQARLLANKYSIVALDASQTALHYAPSPRLRAWSQNLPFASDSFDVLWSSEMLEHLPDELLNLAVVEMKRVVRDWILISVPYREPLRYRLCRCHHCQFEFHVYGHLQTFDLPKLKRLFAPFTLKAWSVCGEANKNYHPGLLFIRQKFGRRWFSLPSAFPICPACGHKEQEIWYGNRLSYWCDRANELYQSIFTVDTQPYWVITLWQNPGNV